MSQVFACPSGALQNPDGTLSCDQWVLVELPAPDPITQMTPQELSELMSAITLVLCIAFGIRVLRRVLEDNAPGRN